MPRFPRLLLATRNRHKAVEIARILKGLPLEFATLGDFPDIPEVAEDGSTLEENAGKKAALPAAASGLWALADDTGLEVEALGGRPGVRTARYAGESAGAEDNIRKLLAELSGVPQERRGAAFRCVVALASPAGEVLLARGELAGRIAPAPRGRGGFGYDPVFLVPSLGRTLAELSAGEKDGLSHRFKALAAARPLLAKVARAPILLSALLLAAPPARAGRSSDPGQRTYWDDMMEAQSARTVYHGAILMEERRYSDAVREFAKAVIAAPKDPNAHRALGVAYYWTGDVDQAMTEFRESVRLDPASAQSQLLLGIAHAWKGDAQKAYDCFREAARLDPSRPDIQMNLGSIEEGLGKIPDALSHLRKAVEIDGSQPLYHFQLGTLYRLLSRDDEAVEELKLAIRRFADYQEAMLELGALYERMGRTADALEMFKRAVRVKSRDAVARFRLARTYLLLGRSAEARDALRGTFHLTPSDEGQGLALSMSYGGKGAGASRQGEEPSPKPASAPAPAGNAPLDVLARNLERVPLDQDAVLDVNMAFLPHPKLAKAKAGEAPSSLKQALEQAGKPPAQLLALRRQYRLDAGSPEAREASIRKVVEDLRQAMAQAPPDSETRLGMNLNFTGRASRSAPSQGERPRVSYNPHDVGNDLDLWVKGTGWMALVEEVLGPAGEGPPEGASAVWWVLEGTGFSLLGDSDMAMAAFEKALRADPREELAYLGIGVAKVIAGDEAGAKEAYRRALALNPKNSAAAEGLKWLSRPSALGKGGAHGS